MSKKSKKSEEEELPYLVFQLCKEKCLTCNYCGYRWGPAHPRPGEKPYWLTDGKKEDNE